MRTDRDAATVLADGFRRIREEHDVPDGFPPEVVAAAEEAGRRPLPADRDDARALPFVTLDPAGATDLDQAMALPTHGDAIALLRHRRVELDVVSRSDQAGSSR